MNQSDITNLKRQITKGNVRGVEREMHYLQACLCRFRCEEAELAPRGHVARYTLYAENKAVGVFDYFANGSRPSVALGLAWKLSGAHRPWLDEDDSGGE